MNTNGLSHITKNLGGIIRKNSPTILTALSVGGLLTTVIFSIKATPKAMILLENELDKRWEEANEKGGIEYDEQLTPLEIVSLTWRCYIPAAAIGAASIACIIGANSINLRRNAALASVYTLTETAFKEYQSKVKETLGENKEERVRDEIVKDRLVANPPGINEIILTGRGDYMCYETLSGRYFRSDIENIRRAINNLNKNFLTDDTLSLNDLYDALGLGQTKLGDIQGWDISRNGLLEVRFGHQLTENDEPCLVLDYHEMPKQIY